jgi:ABC-type iron transport system FetAB ATPase subunit
MFKLLSTANPKIQKGTKLGYLSFILHLAPSDLSGKNTCPKATPGCIAACLNTAGRGGMFKKGENTNMIQKARIRKTVMYFEQRDLFFATLEADIRKAIKFAEKQGLIARVPLKRYERLECRKVGHY